MMIEGLYLSHDSLAMGQDSRMITREEHSLKEQIVRSKVPYRTPRRSQTTHDYKLPSPAFQDIPETRTIYIHQTSIPRDTPESPQGESPVEQHETSQLASIPEEPPKPTSHAPPPTRPRLPPPRRSYSCMDDEPLPAMNSPLSRLALCDLPGELHYAIFDFLDPIDSACLGLANKHYYAIHRRLHGRTPLSAMRSGPNDMEWKWHRACKVVERKGVETLRGDEKRGGEVAQVTVVAPARPTISRSLTSPSMEGDLKQLRVKGQALCRKCGVSRCELHKHLAGWMGEGREYCTVREKFGPTAPEGAKKACYMSNPQDSSRCGRHRDRR